MDISKLYELQKIDANMEKVRRRVAQLRRNMSEPEDLQAVRATAAATGSELERLRAHQLDAELNSRQLTERIQESEHRLMSGEVRNAKELEALQASIESMTRQRAQVDEAAIDALQRGEEADAALQQQQLALAELEKNWQNTHGTLQQDETKYKRIYAQLKQQRQSLTERMTSDSLALYTQLGERKAGVAVASVQNGSCSACNMDLPTGVVSGARASEGNPVFCPSCGRILYAA